MGCLFPDLQVVSGRCSAIRPGLAGRDSRQLRGIQEMCCLRKVFPPHRQPVKVLPQMCRHPKTGEHAKKSTALSGSNVTLLTRKVIGLQPLFCRCFHVPLSFSMKRQKPASVRYRSRFFRNTSQVLTYPNISCHLISFAIYNRKTIDFYFCLRYTIRKRRWST